MGKQAVDVTLSQISWPVLGRTGCGPRPFPALHPGLLIPRPPCHVPRYPCSQRPCFVEGAAPWLFKEREGRGCQLNLVCGEVTCDVYSQSSINAPLRADVTVGFLGANEVRVSPGEWGLMEPLRHSTWILQGAPRSLCCPGWGLCGYSVNRTVLSTWGLQKPEFGLERTPKPRAEIKHVRDWTRVQNLRKCPRAQQ